MGSLWDIARKEVSDSFSSRRFMLIFGLFLLFSLASVYTGISGYEDQMDQFRSGDAHGWTPEKPSLMDVFNPMLGLNMPLAAGLLGLLLSYDAVSKEREEGTIELLLSYPIYRDEVINGKFVAGLFTLALSLLLAFTMSSGLAVFMLDKIPTLNHIYRLSFVWLGTIVYMGFFLALGTLFSTLFRSSWRSLIAGAAVLLASLATPFIAGIAANHVHTYDPGADRPTTMKTTGVAEASASGGRAVERDIAVEPQPVGGSTGPTREEIQQRRERFVDRVSRLSPSTSYQRYVSTMLATNDNQEIEPTVSESLNVGFGYLIFLISQTSLAFTASYGIFMRQDL